MGVVVLAAACGGNGTRPGIVDGGDGPRDATSMADVPIFGGRDAGPDTGPPGECEVEICDNGLDDDCDGVVENGCACLPSTEAACYRGPAATRGVGACTDGVMACTDGEEFGFWGECTGDVLPSDEVCDAAGVDENCDGAVNEGCDCDPAAGPVACGSDVGACAPGAQECVDGRLGECLGAVGPIAELCNGEDDDCDGTVDEGLVRGCGSDTGECAMGTETCSAGAWGACVDAIAPAVEACNAVDDDCDGRVDESLMRGCGSDVGVCSAGNQTCSAGTWSECGGGTVPGIESCNALDDDCDGRTDEGVTRACGSSTGICRPGTATCSMGTFGACTGGVSAGTESCVAGMLDEDCDGAVDEGCGCVGGTTRACGTSTGECTSGMQTCSAGGAWGLCMGSVGPSPEVCNRLDDDCDGASDEGGVCPTAPPVVSCGAAITADVLATVGLSASGNDPDGGTLTWAWTLTTRPAGSVTSPMPPTTAASSLRLDFVGRYVAQACATDDEGERACCTTEIVAEPPGAILVELAWSTAFGDVDLHVLNVNQTPPAGWWTANDCYFANRTPDWGPVGVAANPTLDVDDQSGFGPEQIAIDTSPATGSYHVGVHYFCDRSLGRDPAPGQGPTEATVNVYCDGALLATYPRIALSETDDWVTVARVDYPGCVGRSVNTRTNGTSLLPASFTSARHCELSCAADSDCPTGERCATVGGGGPPRRACVLNR